MPLPAEVGAPWPTICRTVARHRHQPRVFLRELAPHIGFASASNVSAIARAPLFGPASRYLVWVPSFRHSLATHLLRAGASLTDIGKCCVIRLRMPRGSMQRWISRVAYYWAALAWRCAMSALRTALRDYISMRRGLGYKFVQPSSTRRLRDLHGTTRRRRYYSRPRARVAMQPINRRAPGDTSH